MRSAFSGRRDTSRYLAFFLLGILSHSLMLRYPSKFRLLLTTRHWTQSHPNSILQYFNMKHDPCAWIIAQLLLITCRAGTASSSRPEPFRFCSHHRFRVPLCHLRYSPQVLAHVFNFQEDSVKNQRDNAVSMLASRLSR